MRKRQKFVISSVVISLGILLAQAAPLEWRYVLIFLLCGLSYLMSAWSLSEGLGGVEWLTVLLPQAVFTGAVGWFFILLPEVWWARIVLAALFAIGHYALLLSGNIFSVAAIRTIALLRAAQTVSLVMTLMSGFLLFDTIVSFRFPIFGSSILVLFSSLLLSIPALWTVEVGETLNIKIVLYSLVIAFLMSILSISISFWPATISTTSLFLTSMLYCLLGLSSHHFSQRLFKNTVWEYVIVGSVVLITVLVTSLL
ncbi:MAG: hypothetical protein Q8L51_01715 [Candidatus Amesbacteria bacterium]|nr:hypothetical protein [Candidatus Amesbacteria bacterium]